MQKRIRKNKWNRKKIITLSIVGVIIIAIAIVAGAFIKNNTSTSTSAAAQRTVKVSKGNIEVNISGSGTITSANTSDLMANADGKITKAYFTEGDSVKKGDLLYEIDDTDAKLNIQKVENSISQTQLNVNSNKKNYANLTVVAPFSGKVTNVTTVEGENVNNGMSMFTITETSKLELSVPFSTTDIAYIKVGQKVQVNLQEHMDMIEGIITAIDSNTYTASSGGIVQNVEVTVSNPGTITDSSTASVSIKTSSGTELESGVKTFSYANKKSVQAATTGIFSSVNIKENQYVNSGDILIQIENDDLQVTAKTNDLKIQDLNNQLLAAQKTLENYKVYSPIEGTISAVTAVVGDSVKSGSNLISIRDFNQMEFTISVDELDISKVKVGQEVTITVDALIETVKKPLSGEVIYKAMEGTSSNGVATYDVTIKINETENLLAGMNANASIILDKAENALIVPLEAVAQRGGNAFVWVKGSSGNNQQAKAGVGRTAPEKGTQSDAFSSTTRAKMPPAFIQNQEYYANATMRVVEVGLTNDTYIEVKSGLSGGDEVILPPLVAASTGKGSEASTAGSGFNMGGAMGGRMGGQMPSSRRPSGGVMPSSGAQRN